MPCPFLHFIDSYGFPSIFSQVKTLQEQLQEKEAQLSKLQSDLEFEVFMSPIGFVEWRFDLSAVWIS